MRYITDTGSGSQDDQTVWLTDDDQSASELAENANDEIASEGKKFYFPNNNPSKSRK